jgi:ankyrin repeat protein
LHAAVFAGYAEITRRLIEGGANIEAEGFSGIKPLHMAALNGRLEIVTQLLEAGANTEARLEEYSNETPLKVATKKGNSEVAAKLREARKTNARNKKAESQSTIPATFGSNSEKNPLQAPASTIDQTKPTHNNLEGLQKAVLAGSIIGILLLVGILLGNTKTSSLQQPDSNSGNSSTSSSTINSPSLSKMEL